MVREPHYIGEMLISLRYAPELAKLTLVLLKISSMEFFNNQDEENQPVGKSRRGGHHRKKFIFGGHAYLLIRGENIARKRLRSTTVSREGDRSGESLLNQVVFFNIDRQDIEKAEVRIYLEKLGRDGDRVLLGYFFLSESAPGNGVLHWKYIINSPGMPFQMWHSIEKYEPDAFSQMLGQAPTIAEHIEQDNDMNSTLMALQEQQEQQQNMKKQERCDPQEVRKFQHIRPFQIPQPLVAKQEQQANHHGD